jgi:ABC-2 type transport system ATP-binding protein
MSTVTIDHVRKCYGAFVAVDDLSLVIPEGTVFGLLGPNGSGKTSTFKCLLGLARASAGSVRFEGLPAGPERFEHIAYVPEQSALYDWMTVAEHVEMTRRSFRDFAPKRAAELLAEFDVDPRKRVRQLSKGMRTATMVALAFARQADVLILDEPTSGLDPINQRAVLNMIINESARGASIIFSSHQIGQVERAAERIAVLDHGKLVLEGAIDDLKADRKIIEGILPTESTPLDGLAGDSRVLRVDRDGRIVRVVTRDDASTIAQRLESCGAAGVRIVDLNLEDIFLYAVSPANVTAAVVEGSRS